MSASASRTLVRPSRRDSGWYTSVFCWGGSFLDVAVGREVRYCTVGGPIEKERWGVGTRQREVLAHAQGPTRPTTPRGSFTVVVTAKGNQPPCASSPQKLEEGTDAGSLLLCCAVPIIDRVEPTNIGMMSRLRKGRSVRWRMPVGCVSVVILWNVIRIGRAVGDNSWSSLPPPPPPARENAGSRWSPPEDVDVTTTANEDETDYDIGDTTITRRGAAPPYWSSDPRVWTQNGEHNDASQPPPQPPTSLRRNQRTLPIHYNFPKAHPLPLQPEGAAAFGEASRTAPLREDGPDDLPAYASPRRDAVTVYASQSLGHRLLLAGSAATVGAGLAAFLGVSLGGGDKWTQNLSAGTALLFAVCALGLRPSNVYGDLVRALGLALLCTVQRWSHIRRQYPAAPYLRAALALRSPPHQRRPFPPTPNPWTWSNDDDDSDIEFHMLYSVLAMGMVGALVGQTLPSALGLWLPRSLRALVGAVALAYATTRPSAQGDLCRCLGMRLVAGGQLTVRLNRELELVPRAAAVGSHVLDRLLVLDRQHRIRDQLGAAASMLYDQCAAVLRDLQQQSQQQSPQPPQPQSQGSERRGSARQRRGPYDDDGPPRPYYPRDEFSYEHYADAANDRSRGRPPRAKVPRAVDAEGEQRRDAAPPRDERVPPKKNSGIFSPWRPPPKRSDETNGRRRENDDPVADVAAADVRNNLGTTTTADRDQRWMSIDEKRGEWQ